MRTATTVEASGGEHWSEQTDFVVEAEKLGLDVCWVAEAWGSDAPSALGYYAALTDRMLLGSGVIQVGTRTPTAVAQTAITLSNLSGGRFLLGLGASGPQVIEGLHGVPFARPLRRVRETVDIVRQVFAGGKLSYSGAEFSIPLPGSEGVPMRLSMRAEHEIPVYLASLSPAMLELTGEVADGWLGTSFVPEGAADAYFAHLDNGLARTGRTRSELDVCQGAEVAFAPDEDALGAMTAERKKELAFSLGGMGTASTNFYNNAYSRQGWAEVAAEVRERWQAGDRDGAARLVTDDMVLGTTLIGTESMVRRRLEVWRDAGVDTVRLYPAGQTVRERLDTLARAIELVREVGDAGYGATGRHRGKDAGSRPGPGSRADVTWPRGRVPGSPRRRPVRPSRGGR
ncbi:LLM class flavin-dependent oxidoreductase [Streptomyces sp. NPDC004589]|uniref:LLM class flavin-dependent oxidoreductase n=2 Tax=Streptomyces TaxID=1883 RepID=UPI0033B3F725